MAHCFHCDDLFTQGHKQVCKHLFVIEVLGNEEGDTWLEESAEPMISLDALTGIQPRSTRMMQLPVMVHGVRLTDLLDSGSTHNFIDIDTAARAGIKLLGHAGLCVAVVNAIVSRASAVVWVCVYRSRMSPSRSTVTGSPWARSISKNLVSRTNDLRNGSDSLINLVLYQTDPKFILSLRFAKTYSKLPEILYLSEAICYFYL
jgi:hypothetical protein